MLNQKTLNKAQPRVQSLRGSHYLVTPSINVYIDGLAEAIFAGIVDLLSVGISKVQLGITSGHRNKTATLIHASYAAFGCDGKSYL